MTENTATSPAKKQYRVYATQVMYQDVEAANAEEAYRIAEDRGWFEPCEGNGTLTLDPDVKDIETDEFIRVNGDDRTDNPAGSSAQPALPYSLCRSQNADVYRGEEHWAVLDREQHIIADIETGPGDEARAEYIVRACNSRDELLEACQMSLKDARDALSGEWEPTKEGWESIIEHLTRVLSKATEQDHETTA